MFRLTPLMPALYPFFLKSGGTAFHRLIGQTGAAGMAIDERNPRADEVCTCTAQVNRVGNLPSWRQRLRTHVVSRGIQMMCGSTVDVSADAAADIPLVRAAVRLSWLKALNAVGVTRFIATSKIGYDFVCHTGDLANFSG